MASRPWLLKPKYYTRLKTSNLAKENPSHDQNQEHFPSHETESKDGRYSWRLSLLFFTIATAFVLSNGISFWFGGRIWPNMMSCIERTTVWSPALEALEYYDTTLQNEFNASSIYRGPPTKEREMAWQNLSERASMSIPEDKLALLNKSEGRDGVKYARHPDGGYMARLEVFHQLHCLDYIRQYTWYQAGAYGPDSLYGYPAPNSMLVSDIGRRMHADHCFEALRKTLMCHADVSPMLVLVDEASDTGMIADFNTHMKCRDFEKIDRWYAAHIT